MKTKLFFFFLLSSGMCQFTSAYNGSDRISESSTALSVDSFTFADDATDLTITVNGDNVNPSSHHLYIDTDNNPATGDPAHGGADFRVENGAANRWVSGAWVWEWHAGNIAITDNPGVSVQFKINRNYLPILNMGAQINVYFTNLLDFVPVDGERLPATGMVSYTTLTGTPPPNLESLTITDEDETTITMTVLGAGIETTYDVFIDTDNNATTGFSTGGIGADVLLQSGLSYDFSGADQNTWGWAQHAVSAINSVTEEAGVSRIFVLDRAILGLVGSGLTLDIMYSNTGGNTDTLPIVSYTTGTLSVENVSLDYVSIYKTNNSTLAINGLIQGKSNLKLFDMLGKQVLNAFFTLNGVQEISLPNLNTGIYLIRLETELGILSKKIIL